MVTPNFQQQAAQITIYIKKESDGFQAKVKRADGGPAGDIVEALSQVFGMACQNFGMTVKM